MYEKGSAIRLSRKCADRNTFGREIPSESGYLVKTRGTADGYPP